MEKKYILTESELINLLFTNRQYACESFKKEMWAKGYDIDSIELTNTYIANALERSVDDVIKNSLTLYDVAGTDLLLYRRY